MHKFEIHTLTSSLDDLNFLIQEHTEQIGCFSIGKIGGMHPSSPVNGNGTRSGRLGLHSSAFKVEAYIHGEPEPIMEKLRSLPSIAGAEYYPCRQLDLAGIVEAEQVIDSVQTPAPKAPKKAASPSKPVSRRVLLDITRTGKRNIQLKVTANKSPYFLYKIFGILGLHGLIAAGGRKFRQVDQDFGIFKIIENTPGAMENAIERLQSELETEDWNEALFEEIAHPILEQKPFRISLDNSGALSVIHVKAGHPPLMRFAVQEALCAHELEVAISRMTGNGKMIDDVFYVKTFNNKKVNPNLIPVLETEIIGK